eukprot:TRINITY_DN141_c0_g1_i4.p1 TRINITY_DN141_c0_g1~~TRINITY_DN141_c0_g1_i4.p1  ORF type:complete len:216 (-),score=35.89 TRINITY_DN141_c0_g1_i4:101-748(-)
MKVAVILLLSLFSIAVGDQLCTDCEKLVASLLEFLTNTEVQGIVVTQLNDQVCTRLGADLQQPCEEYVQALVPSIFAYVDEKVDPKEVCTTATVCPGAPSQDAVLQTIAFYIQAAHESARAKGYDLHNGGACEYCTLVVDELHQVIANPQIQSDLKAGLMKLCEFLPFDTQECSTLVAQYADQIFSILEQYVMGPVLCPQLGFCPSPPSFQEMVA